MNDSEKPPSKAAALQYDGKNAPTLIAKGSGKLAQQIIEKAKQHEVHIHNDPILLEVLGRLELGDEIPHSLYLAVAKIIAFAYFLQGKHPEYNKTSEKTALLNQAELSPKTSDTLEGDNQSSLVK